MMTTVTDKDEQRIKVLASLQVPDGDERFLCVNDKRELLLLKRPPGGPTSYVGPACSMAEAELMARAVLAGDNYVATHPQTLIAVCLAVVANAVVREARQVPGAAADAAAAPERVAA